MAYDYDRIVPKPSQLSQSPLMPGHLGQTLVSDMTFYCRPDVVGSLDSSASRSNFLFCFYGSAPIVIERYLSLQKFKMPEFKNTASLNENAKIGHVKITQTAAFNYMSYHSHWNRGIHPARTERPEMPLPLKIKIGKFLPSMG